MSKLEYKYHAVAFIDVLGQREAFLDLNHDDFKDNGPKLIEVHKKTAKVVEQLRADFKNFFDAFGKDTDVILSLPEPQRSKLQEMKKTEIKTYQFVDTILAYTSLKAEKHCSNGVHGVHGLLMACGSLMLLSLSLGRSFRAAIDVGIGTDLKNGEVYGPVSYQVYKLESTVAQYPRIVLGEEILQYINVLCAEQKQFPEQTVEDIRICKVIAEECKKLIIYDLDGQPILDYLGNNFNNSIGHNPDIEKMHISMLKEAHKFVKDEYERRKKSLDRKLTLRYFLLLNYFNSKLNKAT